MTGQLFLLSLYSLQEQKKILNNKEIGMLLPKKELIQVE